MAERRRAAAELEASLREQWAAERASAAGPAEREDGSEERGGSSPLTRAAVIAGTAAAILVVGLLLLASGPSYEVTATFQNASQLVKGNSVDVGGRRAGTVAGVSLGPHGEALVKMKIEGRYAPLRQGTQAVIRSQSLSGIANRFVELNMPPATNASAETIPDGALIPETQTVSEVDLDQLFNTFDKRTVKNFKNVLTGFAISYDGVGKQSNEGFRYANPLFSTSRRVFGALNSDQHRLESLIVDSAALTSALDSRAPDVSALIHNVDLMMGAIGRQSASLSSALTELPGFMRTFNTTAVNLRSTLDDLDPLVNASKPVAKKLQPFAANLRGFANDAVPAIRDLDRIVHAPGKANDLIDLTRLQIPLGKIAAGPVVRNGASREGAFPATTSSLEGGLPQLAFFRPYVTNEAISGWFDDFSGVSGFWDANGGSSRISTTFNAFTLSTPTPSLPQLVGAILAGPVPINQVFDPINGLLQLNKRKRCPGSNERDPGDGSTPFTDHGTLDCDPTQVPTGP
jgi:phospholipid/cholesterol/gamma-HCH transport system substrate-binding protein